MANQKSYLIKVWGVHCMRKINVQKMRVSTIANGLEKVFMLLRNMNNNKKIMTINKSKS